MSKAGTVQIFAKLISPAWLKLKVLGMVSAPVAAPAKAPIKAAARPWIQMRRFANRFIRSTSVDVDALRADLL